MMDPEFSAGANEYQPYGCRHEQHSEPSRQDEYASEEVHA